MSKSVLTISCCTLILCFSSTAFSFQNKQTTDRKRAARELPQQQFSSEQSTKYADGLFRVYDKNRNGFLDSPELGEMRRPPSMAYDIDSDNRISKEELINALWKRTEATRSVNQQSGPTEQNTKTWPNFDFDDSDTNGDGHLSKSEILEAIKKSRQPTAAQMTKAFADGKRADKSEQAPVSSLPPRASIKFDILLAPPGTPLQTANQLIDRVNEETGAEAKKLFEQSGFVARDSFNFLLTDGNETKLHSSGEEFRTSTRYQSNSRAVQGYVPEVYTTLKVSSETHDEHIRLFVDLEKSDTDTNSKDISATEPLDAAIDNNVQISVSKNSKDGITVIGDKKNVDIVNKLIQTLIVQSQVPSSISVQTQFDCPRNGTVACLVSHAGHHWVILTQAKF